MHVCVCVRVCVCVPISAIQFFSFSVFVSHVGNFQMENLYSKVVENH